jgi:hypothetical protein
MDEYLHYMSSGLLVPAILIPFTICLIAINILSSWICILLVKMEVQVMILTDFDLVKQEFQSKQRRRIYG